MKPAYVIYSFSVMVQPQNGYDYKKEKNDKLKRRKRPKKQKDLHLKKVSFCQSTKF